VFSLDSVACCASCKGDVSDHVAWANVLLDVANEASYHGFCQSDVLLKSSALWQKRVSRYEEVPSYDRAGISRSGLNHQAHRGSRLLCFSLSLRVVRAVPVLWLRRSRCRRPRAAFVPSRIGWPPPQEKQMAASRSWGLRVASQECDRRDTPPILRSDKGLRSVRCGPPWGETVHGWSANLTLPSEVRVAR
jgi:hypothetical protein